MSCQTDEPAVAEHVVENKPNEFYFAKAFVQKKKSYNWLKNVSVLAAGGLIGGGLVALKTNPGFYGNIVSAVRGSAVSESVLNFYGKVVSGVNLRFLRKLFRVFTEKLFQE